MTTDLINVGASRVPRNVRLAVANEHHRALRVAVRIDALSAVGSHAHRRLAGVAASQRAFAELVPEASEHLAVITAMTAAGISAAIGRLAFEDF